GMDGRAHAGVILAAGLAREGRRGVDRPWPHRGERVADVLRAEAAGEHYASFCCCGRAPVRGIAVLPRLVEHACDKAAVAQEHCLAAAHAATVVGIELNEVRRRFRGLCDEG